MLELYKEHPLWEVDLIIFAFYEGHNITCSLKLIEKSSDLNISSFFFGTKQFGHNLNWITEFQLLVDHLSVKKPDEEIYKIS